MDHICKLYANVYLKAMQIIIALKGVGREPLHANSRLGDGFVGKEF